MTSPAGLDGLVRIASGRLRGTELDGLFVWRGIPYAAPPVGLLRFRPPQPPQFWAGVRPAADHGPVAWQSKNAVRRSDPGRAATYWVNSSSRRLLTVGPT